MALKPCKECDKEVSTKADTCPHCGVKNPAKKTKKTFRSILIAIVVLMIFSAILSVDSEESTQTVESRDKQTILQEDKQTAEEAIKKEAEELAACKSDLKCWAEKNSVTANARCRRPVERLAAYSAEWTDRFYEPKFSHFKWANQERGYITYVGDKIQFENGFGAMQNHIYECDFDPETESVLEVRARPGRFN